MESSYIDARGHSLATRSLNAFGPPNRSNTCVFRCLLKVLQMYVRFRVVALLVLPNPME